MKHGRERYFIKGSGWVIGSLIPKEQIADCFRKYALFAAPKPDPIDPPQDEPLQRPRRVFCRLFSEGGQSDPEGLIELGLAMESERVGVSSTGDSNIPAGYTYLGQFVDHDITSDPTPLSVTGSVDPATIENSRTPSLDLDCLYGSGPQGSPDLYESDGASLRVGHTSPTTGNEPGAPIRGDFPNDLPRDPMKKALIGDPRNDENLAVAQTHLAFIKFHNKTVKEIAESQGLRGEKLFEAASREVILRYQSIVLTDLLPRIVEKEALQDVISEGPKFYTEEHHDCMPVEFSAAAYRLGHSMVRPEYEWNRVFNSEVGGVIATMELLFEFSEVSGSRGQGDDPFFGKSTLPSNWIIDWRRFYDFSAVSEVQNHPSMNRARELDTRLSFALQTLPEIQKRGQGLPEFLFSLATRNLLRGRLLKLPTGQEVANEMQAAGITFEPISNQDILGSPHQEILEKHGFHEKTPLWYYILREAKLKHGGNKLGPVGSRLVAEVFVGLISNSKVSIFATKTKEFSMPQLLADVGDLNPLEDAS